MAGRATRSRPGIPLHSPLKPTTRLHKENAAGSKKRARSSAGTDAHEPAKRIKHDAPPLSPKPTNIELAASNSDDNKNTNTLSVPVQQQHTLSPATPTRVQQLSLPTKTPGTAARSRLPMPSSARKPFLGFKSSSSITPARPRFIVSSTSSSTTPARPNGPLTRAANIRRYKQPVAAPKATATESSSSCKIFAVPMEVQTTVPEDTARETQASLSRLDEALRRLAAPRPAPRSRPASSLGFASTSSTMEKSSASSSSNHVPDVPRPGTSLGFAFASPSKIPLPVSPTKRMLETIPGSPSRLSLGAPTAPIFVPSTPTRSISLAAPAPPSSISRRASAASRGLTRTLSEMPPIVPGPVRSKKEAIVPAVPAGTGSRAPSSRIAAIRASQPQPSPPERSVKKEEEKEKKPHLDVLKHCTIFVDVRTDEGDDAAALFIDMLRGLGARILTRVSPKTTHIVFKSGLPGTIARYRTLSEPRPHIVGIGWVVECAEKRAHADEDRFTVDLDNAETGQKRRPANAPLNPIRPLRLRQPDEDDDEEEVEEEGLTLAEESFLEFEFEKSILGNDKGPKQREIRDFFTPVGRGESKLRAGTSRLEPTDEPAKSTLTAT